ncbi:MAG: lipid A deacylase LpxR family protein [Thermoanaerobaculia bacterium]|nr:lipid A deacylase LpxR family protein [Thermoanaerobaculia bacterium]
MKKTIVSIVRLLAIGALAGGFVLGAAADEPRWSGWQFQGENDALALFSGSDEHYTNGIRFAMVRNPKNNPDWVGSFHEWYCARFCGRQAYRSTLGWSFGQNLFTPDDISIETLIPDDRPYAAVLYGSLFVDFIDDHETVKQTVELQIGIVGPEAGGEWLQTEFHELIDDELPQGWDNQLAFEPIVNLNYRHENRVILVGDKSLGLANVDVIPQWGFGFGNLMTRFNLGGTLRLGWNIGGFPQADIVNVFGGGSERDVRKKFEAYVFVGAEGRAVLRNLMLDGNTFKDSHHVDKRPGVYDLRGGFFVRYEKWQFNYTFVSRSQEFDPARGDHDGRHDYGSFTLSCVIPVR